MSYRSSRVIGGTNAEESEFPFIVSLTRRGGHFCGAAIVNDQWILTAGHCVCKSVVVKDVSDVHCFIVPSLLTFSGLNRILKPNQIKSVFGLHSIASFKDNVIETNAFEMDIKKIETHPNYRCESVKDDIGTVHVLKFLIYEI